MQWESEEGYIREWLYGTQDGNAILLPIEDVTQGWVSNCQVNSYLQGSKTNWLKVLLLVIPREPILQNPSVWQRRALRFAQGEGWPMHQNR